MILSVFSSSAVAIASSALFFRRVSATPRILSAALALLPILLKSIAFSFYECEV